MIDIVTGADGLDLGTVDTQTIRAANILSVQIESLEYAPDVGIDLKYFLSEDFKFQNESFKAYLIQVLATFGINVSSVADTVDKLFSSYVINLTPPESQDSLIAR